MNAKKKGIVKANYLLEKIKEFLLINQLGVEIMDVDIEKHIVAKLNPDLADLSILKKIVDYLELQNKI